MEILTVYRNRFHFSQSGFEFVFINLNDCRIYSRVPGSEGGTGKSRGCVKV